MTGDSRHETIALQLDDDRSNLRCSLLDWFLQVPDRHEPNPTLGPAALHAHETLVGERSRLHLARNPNGAADRQRHAMSPRCVWDANQTKPIALDCLRLLFASQKKLECRASLVNGGSPMRMRSGARMWMLMENAVPQRKAEQHLGEEALGIRRIGFRERRELRDVAVVERAALRLRGERDESRFELLHVRLVEVLVLARERDAARPEISLRRVLLEPGPDRIALAHVDARQPRLFGRADEHVHTGACEFLALACVAEERTRHDDAAAAPVGFLDVAQAVGVAGGEENLDESWGAMPSSLLASESLDQRIAAQPHLPSADTRS